MLDFSSTIFPFSRTAASFLHFITCSTRRVIVGKRDTCPYCKEKVSLKSAPFLTNFWGKQDVMYTQLLDGIRYLVAWQPVIFTLVHGINLGLGLE